MSAPHTIPRAPRLRTGLGTLFTALGVLIAVATITFIALTAANHTTAATPATPSQAAAGPTPHTQYLGPAQQSARPNSQAAQIQGVSSPTTDAANPSPRYTCLGVAHYCLP